MQKIFIVGGSNSLLRRGWTAHFKESYSDRFDISNLSVGAATSLMGVFRLLREEVSDGATVVWEYALNESNHFRSGQSLESLLHHLDWFMETARRRNIRVLPLIFWTRREHETKHKNKYRAALSERFSDYGVSVIDAWRAVEDFSGKQGISVSELFSGNMHYSVDAPFLRDIADLVGGGIADATVPKPISSLDGMSLELCVPAGEADEFRNSVIHTSTYSLNKNVGGIEIEARGNLLASFVIAANEAGAISVVADDEPVGIYSLQVPSDMKSPSRILKHIVHWQSKDDMRHVRNGFTVSGCNPIDRPVVQNMFAWRGPVVDEGRMDAYICSLLER